MTATLRERLLSRLIIDPSGCLLWTGCIGADGYGRMYAGKSGALVHRVMWEMFEDPIPDGFVPDHLCRIRHCASLAHLELVTVKENILRGVSPAAFHAARDHCDQGHFLNLIRSDGGRRCEICTRDAARERMRRFRARRKAAAS